MNRMPNELLALIFFITGYLCFDVNKHSSTIKIEVDTAVSTANCSRYFLGFGLPHFYYKWGRFQISSPKTIVLAKYLRDSVVRIYGTPVFTEEDMKYFEDYHQTEETTPSPSENDTRPKRDEGFIVSGSDGSTPGDSQAEFVAVDHSKMKLTSDLWLSAVEFVQAVKWRFMFAFSAMDHVDGRWVSRYAETFLDINDRLGLPIPEFQLGNELQVNIEEIKINFLFIYGFDTMTNVLNRKWAYWQEAITSVSVLGQPNIYDKGLKINSSQVATDFAAFKSLLAKYPSYRSSKIIGPDVTRFAKSKTFLEQFLQAGGCNHVDEISFHHYYYNGKDVVLEDFFSVPKLESYLEHIKVGKNLLQKHNCTKPIRLTETSSATSGGAVNLSDTFVASFSWMDKLGQSALHGITQVIRHTFFGSHYALIDNNLNPNPDYYLTAMFKRFVEGPVFKVKKGLPSHIRAYANCAREYPPGSLVIYLMNVGNTEEYVNFSQYFSDTLSVYRFTPVDLDLQSKRVLLNNEELVMEGYNVPFMRESRELADSIFIPALSYGFIVLTSARVPVCIEYFSEQSIDSTSQSTLGPLSITTCGRSSRPWVDGWMILYLIEFYLAYIFFHAVSL